jgi:hypothetical protein
VKQHLGRQSGVQKVEVRLLDGGVDVTPKEDGQIDPAQLLKATHDSGVTVEEMDVTPRGRIVKDSSGSLALEVESNRSFAIAPDELSKGLEPLCGVSNDGHGSRSVVQEARREKESGPFDFRETADSGSAEEGIDAKTMGIPFEPCCSWTRWM